MFVKQITEWGEAKFNQPVTEQDCHTWVASSVGRIKRGSHQACFASSVLRFIELFMTGKLDTEDEEHEEHEEHEGD